MLNKLLNYGICCMIFVKSWCLCVSYIIFFKVGNLVWRKMINTRDKMIKNSFMTKSPPELILHLRPEVVLFFLDPVVELWCN